ncbi:hypothetical protein Ciccas_005230 [Cichlidogyrus casuarinus]|uniref:Uncharacterized protein n=1 Tax=Cichlidogyrus casuarinus TaxID=1844966 RepID=A0ABD2Q9P0_9PLAT
MQPNYAFISRRFDSEQMYNIIHNSCRNPADVFAAESTQMKLFHNDYSTSYGDTVGSWPSQEAHSTFGQSNRIVVANHYRANNPHPTEFFMRHQIPRYTFANNYVKARMNTENSNKGRLFERSIYQKEYPDFSDIEGGAKAFAERPKSSRPPLDTSKDRCSLGIIPNAILSSRNDKTTYEEEFQDSVIEVYRHARNVDEGLRRAYRGKCYDHGSTELARKHEPLLCERLENPTCECMDCLRKRFLDMPKLDLNTIDTHSRRLKSKREVLQPDDDDDLVDCE